jgi:hypothetical protein
VRFPRALRDPIVWCAVGALVATVHTAVNARLLRRPGPRPVSLGGRPRVAVLLPLRDEVERLEPCLRSLLGQHYPDGELQLLVLDDRSTDGTGALVEKLTGEAPRSGAEPPPGWLGKPHACQQLADAAGPEADVLVFVDADVALEPFAIAAAVDQLDALGLDLVSPYPRQLTGTPAERLVQPLLQWSWLTFLPLRAAERSSRPSLSAANGQFLVVRADTYRAAGGHAAVRGEILEDIALLRAIKVAGGRGVVTDGSALATCRMYTSWPELRDGYSKSLWAAFGSPAGAVAGTGMLAALYVVPAVAALAGHRAGLAGYAAGVAGRVIAARATGGRVWPDAVAHPVSVAMFGALVARSWWGHHRGTLHWRGRPV